MLLLSAVALSSCSFLDEPTVDCDPHYKVRFRYDMNMLYADAFATQVSEVRLFVFDEEDNLVWTGSESGEALAEEGYLMDLPLKPGRYSFVAWCGKEHENAAGFEMQKVLAPSRRDDLRMKLQRSRDGGAVHSSTDLHALFHGRLNAVVLPDKEGTHIVTVPLTKDTNSIRIMLVHLDGSEISADDFDFTITDSNGFLDHDNTILTDEQIEYRTWAKREGVAQTVPPLLESGSRAAITAVHSVVAELTVSRLQTSQRPMLTVTRKSDGEPVVNIPLIDYFLMVKGEYHNKMTDDEFLDRQDDYSMTFFMHEDGTWYKQVLDILNWRVVNQAADL